MGTRAMRSFKDVRTKGADNGIFTVEVAKPSKISKLRALNVIVPSSAPFVGLSQNYGQIIYGKKFGKWPSLSP
jgi:hypothetical protein